jgi:DNA-binding response OmpR family regulator
VDKPKRPRILVADDEAEIRKVMRTAFEAKGYEVEEVDNGFDAILYVEAKRPDLVLLDIRMPSLDGWAALAEIRKLPAAPPVIIVSSVDEINMSPMMIREGVAAYLSKPFRIDELMATCQSVLAISATTGSDIRREAARKPVSLDVTILSPDGRPLHKGTAVNLSTLGAQVDLETALALGGRVQVLFHRPIGGLFSFRGVVMWWRRLHPAQTAIISNGLAFTGLTPDERQRIGDFLEQL